MARRLGSGSRRLRNEPDLDDVPADVLESVAVHPVGDVLDIISAALEEPVAESTAA